MSIRAMQLLAVCASWNPKLQETGHWMQFCIRLCNFVELNCRRVTLTRLSGSRSRGFEHRKKFDALLVWKNVCEGMTSCLNNATVSRTRLTVLSTRLMIWSCKINLDLSPAHRDGPLLTSFPLRKKSLLLLILMCR